MNTRELAATLCDDVDTFERVRGIVETRLERMPADSPTGSAWRDLAASVGKILDTLRPLRAMFPAAPAPGTEAIADPWIAPTGRRVVVVVKPHIDLHVRAEGGAPLTETERTWLFSERFATITELVRARVAAMHITLRDFHDESDAPQGGT